VFLDYVALAILFFVVITLFYAIIAIHDVPYEIAKHRGHPHQDAIHVAGWVSLFTLHAIWPFLWIWAMMYRPDRGWGFGERAAQDQLSAELARLQELWRSSNNLEAMRLESNPNKSRGRRPTDGTPDDSHLYGDLLRDLQDL
jgi:hypothetical protein